MELLGRGVYRAPCLNPQGKTILFAVDHASRRIENGVICLENDSQLDSAVASLWLMLDAQDPDFARRKTPRSDLPPAAKIASLIVAMWWLPLFHFALI